MDEETLLLFDDYLQGALSPEAKKTFESRLKTEPALNDAFIIFRDVNQHLSHHLSEERAAFKDTLKTVADQHLDTSVAPKKPVKVIRFNPWKYAIAAAVIVLIGLTFMFSSGDPLYADYAFNESISLVERDGEGTAFAKAETAFNAKEYQEAITYFNAILASDDANAEVQYYKGIALVEVGKYDEADAIFSQLADGNTLYKDKATWYGALSKLKQGDKQACKQLLEKIPAGAEDHEVAQELLKKL